MVTGIPIALALTDGKRKISDAPRREVRNITPEAQKVNMKKKALYGETLDDAIYEATQDKAWRTRSMGSTLRIATKYLDFNKALESYIHLHRGLLQSARE